MPGIAILPAAALLITMLIHRLDIAIDLQAGPLRLRLRIRARG